MVIYDQVEAMASGNEGMAYKRAGKRVKYTRVIRRVYTILLSPKASFFTSSLPPAPFTSSTSPKSYWYIAYTIEYLKLKPRISYLENREVLKQRKKKTQREGI